MAIGTAQVHRNTSRKIPVVPGDPPMTRELGRGAPPWIADNLTRLLNDTRLGTSLCGLRSQPRRTRKDCARAGSIKVIATP